MTQSPDLSDRMLLARRYFEGGSYEKCLDALARAGDDALEDPDFWFLRAESLRRLSRRDEAVAVAKEGLARRPEDLGLLDSLGLALVGLGNVQGGDQVYRAALTLAPEHPALLAHHAIALAKLGSVAEARSVLTTLMAVEPDSIRAFEARAQVAFELKDPGVDRYIAELLGRDPENANARILRGKLAFRRRDARPAAQNFSEAAALNPANASVARAAREMRIAANPMLAPSRRIFMLGRRRARGVYLVIVVALLLLHQEAAALVFACLWVVMMGIVPRALRRHYRRRYGAL